MFTSAKHLPDGLVMNDVAPIMTSEDETDCAWCLKRKGIKPTEGSHGICKMDALAVLAESALRREAKRAQQWH